MPTHDHHQPALLILDDDPDELRRWLAPVTAAVVDLRAAEPASTRSAADREVPGFHLAGVDVVYLPADGPMAVLDMALAQIARARPGLPFAVAVYDPYGGPPPTDWLQAIASRDIDVAADLTTARWSSAVGAWVTGPHGPVFFNAMGPRSQHDRATARLATNLSAVGEASHAHRWLGRIMAGTTVGRPLDWCLALRALYVEQLVTMLGRQRPETTREPHHTIQPVTEQRGRQ